MTKDDILIMAKEAGIDSVIYPITGVFFDCYQQELERFAALVAEKEREECAKVCEEQEKLRGAPTWHCAAAIRARNTIWS
jgi:hypothetical protein